MGSDADLTRRIALTLALLLLVDLVSVFVLATLLSPWLTPIREAMAATLSLGPTTMAVVWWAAVLVPALAVFVWAQLRYTRRQTLAQVDARPVTREECPELVDRVRRLAQQADVQVPTVAISPSDVANSFAVGTLGNATVVVSEGLLAELDGDELDAVLAHEVAHVANRDATVMTLASFLPALTNGEYGLLDDVAPDDRGGTVALLAVAVVGAAALASAIFQAPVWSATFLAGSALLAGLTVVLGGVLLGVLTAPVVYLSRSLSRYREFAADQAAASMTGEPAVLADALQRLDGDVADAPAADKRRVYEGVRGLCFLPHGFEDRTRNGRRSRFYVETRSHPPTPERIERLKAVTCGA